MPQYSLSDEVLEPLQAGTLFYPSAGYDIATPIEIFSSRLNNFWFIDTIYGGEPLLREDSDYRPIPGQSREKIKTGRTLKKHEPFEIKIYQETYERKQDQRRITVHQCKGRGYDAFRTLRTLLKSQQTQLSVFFYRGDSPTTGEGGSGFYWLKKPRLKDILEVLEDYGLIISDGSNAIRELSTFHRSSGVESAAQERVQPFTFANRLFECVGYLGERYGPTLVWQVKRISPGSPYTENVIRDKALA